MLARSLYDARQERGWSIAELASRAHADSQQIRRLEAGTASAQIVEAAAQALELRLSHMPAAQTLAEQLELQRRRRGMSSVDLATVTGMSRMTIRSVLAGGGSLASMNKLVAALAPRACLKPPPRASWHRVTRRAGDDQFTPREFIVLIESVFGSIDLDPAWHPNSGIAARRTFSLAGGQDGLAEPWPAELVWLNPPYSQLLRWLRKADAEWSAGRARTIVCLVPARLDSPWVHDRLAKVADILLLRRRMRFVQVDGRMGNQAPYTMMLVMFGASAEQRVALQQAVPGLWVERRRRD